MNYLGLLYDLYKSKKNTSMTAEQVKELQNKKLRKVLKYAYDNSKYYKKTFEDAGITRDKIDNFPITAFPSIDKKILLENFDEIITVKNINQEEIRKFDESDNNDKQLLKGYHVVHSSGSTQKPGYFIYDKKAWNQMIVGIIRAALWNMNMKEILKLLKDKPRIAYIAATDGRYGGAMAVGSGVDNLGLKQIFLDIKTPLTEWIREIKEFKPNIIIGYPSAIKILGELIEKGEIELKNTFRVISCGEPLGINLRQYFEKIFNCDVINFYGASESLAIGVESNSKDGMFLFDDMNYIEIENDVMYLTSLYNYAQPLIRYKISDQLHIKTTQGESRYCFTNVESIVGRNEDLLWFENTNGEREFLHPLAIEGFCIDGLLDYQFKKVDKSSFEMYAEISNDNKKESVEAEMLEQMSKILAEKKIKYVKFSIKFVEKIMADCKTGKKKLIIS